MGLLIEKGLYKLTSTPVTVSLAGVAATTLYTVPTGKIMIPFAVCLVAGADCGVAQVTLGRSTALTDFLTAQTLGSIDASGDMAWLMPIPAASPVLLKTYAAAVIFQIDVTVVGGGATNYVDLFGWLKNA